MSFHFGSNGDFLQKETFLIMNIMSNGIWNLSFLQFGAFIVCLWIGLTTLTHLYADCWLPREVDLEITSSPSAQAARRFGDWILYKS